MIFGVKRGWLSAPELANRPIRRQRGAVLERVAGITTYRLPREAVRATGEKDAPS